MTRRASRSGYAMAIVVVFIALVFSLFGVAHRQMASALRIETARTLQHDRDTGSVQAVARGLSLLETGLPPSDPYVCGTTIGSAPDERSYTVTFRTEGPGQWSVHAALTQWPDAPEPMPPSFAGGS